MFERIINVDHVEFSTRFQTIMAATIESFTEKIESWQNLYQAPCQNFSNNKFLTHLVARKIKMMVGANSVSKLFSERSFMTSN